MEVKELISFYVDETSNILEVTFRTIDDSEDEIRQDTIELENLDEFDIDFLFEKVRINEDFDDEFDYGMYDDLDNGIGFDEVISFLNEYYLVYPDRLPKPELF